MLEAVADSHQPADDREQCENHQRNQHHHRAFMRLAVAMFIVTMLIMTVGGVSVTMLVNLGSAIVTEKCHEQQTEHVERGDEGGDNADQPEHPASVFARVCLP